MSLFNPPIEVKSVSEKKSEGEVTKPVLLDNTTSNSKFVRQPSISSKEDKMKIDTMNLSVIEAPQSASPHSFSIASFSTVSYAVSNLLPPCSELFIIFSDCSLEMVCADHSHQRLEIV
jgi:hypothetical protein